MRSHAAIEARRQIRTESARRKVAHALGFMNHEWYREDPENGDIWCQFCKVVDSSEGCSVGFGPCPKKPVPPSSQLQRTIESRRKRAWRELIKLAELEELLT